MLIYQDDQIEISVQVKGGSDGNPKLTIDTKFCLTITWDNKMALYVSCWPFHSIVFTHLSFTVSHLYILFVYQLENS